MSLIETVVKKLHPSARRAKRALDEAKKFFEENEELMREADKCGTICPTGQGTTPTDHGGRHGQVYRRA
jgi:hypothetical protein